MGILNIPSTIDIKNTWKGDTIKMEYGPGIIKELAIVHPMNYVFELISYGEQYRISTVIQPSLSQFL
ncbi:MAG: hypothetical protein U5Q03_04660 [Bacteroidota bacterium]|nr:hypothetical protein [Bacteroidota bacterium]